MSRRGPHYCECGNLITRKFARYCDKCGKARMANGGYVSITSYNRLKEIAAERRTSHQTIPVKAKCPKCRVLHDVQVRHDPGRLLWEFCKHHKGLRQMEYFPDGVLSRAIRLMA